MTGVNEQWLRRPCETAAAPQFFISGMNQHISARESGS
jgi:hypothetical protein